MIVGICGEAGSGKDASADFLVKNHDFVKVAFADPLKRICQDVFGFTDEQLWGPSAKRNAPVSRWEHGARQYREAALRDFASGRARALTLVSAEYPWQDDETVLTFFAGAINYATEGWLTPRYALQQLGSEWGRRCSPDTWARYALDVHAQLQSGYVYYESRVGVRPLVGHGEAMRAKTDVIISDVRFANEVHAIHAVGGMVVRIVRKERPAPKVLSGPAFEKIPDDLWELVENTAFLTTLNTAAAAHVSETEQKTLPDDLFDHHIINGGNDLGLLEAAVVGLAETLRST